MKLSEYLEREYTKVRRPGGEDWLVVDDETGRDVPGYHCPMRVQVLNDKEFTLALLNCFVHPALLDRLKSLGAKIIDDRGIREATLKFRTNQVKEIRDLATAIRGIYYQGEEYQRKIWPWSCPRTADSIDRLADFIMEYRRTGKHEVLAPQPLPPAAGPKRTPKPRTPTRRTPNPDEDDIFEILESYAKLPELVPSVI